MRLRAFSALLALVPLIALAAARAEDAPERWRLPPSEIAELVDARPTPEVRVDPTRRRLLLVEPEELPTIAELARPELRLAGLRLDPRTNGPSRARRATGLALVAIEGGQETRIEGLPKDARIGDVSWSPDGERFAFSLTKEDAIELWLAEVAIARARRLGALHLSDALGDPIDWLGNEELVARVVPEGRGAPPAKKDAPEGPNVEESAGKKKAPARTFQDLLRTAHDEALFEHYVTSQLARVDVKTGEARLLGKSGLIRGSSPSPDGRFVLVVTIHRPFSRQLPLARFPHRIEVLDARTGERVKEVADVPLADDVPVTFSAVAKGPRHAGWRADAPATLAWVEAQDGGDPEKKAEVRDRLFLLSAPFEGPPVRLADLGLRFHGLVWGTGRLALVTERWWKTRREKTWVLAPDEPEAAPRLLFDRSYEDRYKDPGHPLLRALPSGYHVLKTSEDGRKVFLAGDGASTEGDRPFVDALELETKKTSRLFHSPESGTYERPIDLLEQGRLLLRRESLEEPPNVFLRPLGAEVATADSSSLVALTRFPHPALRLKGAKVELLRYEREDGVKLTAKLHLPPGWSEEKGPLPTLVWVYPAEFKSAEAAGQVRDSPFRFVRPSPSSPMLLLARGWAVVENPAFPIVGEGKQEPNDTYVEQLVAGARALVKELVRRRVSSEDRIAISGHSYGAFTTVNLLAHSDLFRCGIARSGAYNRTLTPFGFQAEERTMWQAPEVYVRLSPLMHADRIDEPLLLVHGEADSNPGTFPFQSERLFQALKGHGRIARLVLLPHESHGYQARESVMHVWWETIEWLERYVVRADPRASKGAKSAEGAKGG